MNRDFSTQCKRLVIVACLGLSCLAYSGCSIGYLAHSAYQGAKLLSERKPIESVIANPETPSQLRQRLELARSVLQYANTIGLNPNGAYSSFVKIDGGALSWILMASKTTSFELKTWWFPIVGTVPYKGFFSKDDAISAGRELRALGYEGLVRPTAAFSTLGWFNDPILSTFTDGDEIHLINTILHELVHRRIWIPNDVTANESLANFVGTEATITFLQSRMLPEFLAQQLPSLVFAANKARDDMYSFAQVLNELHSKLSRIYESSLTSTEKLELRKVVFAAYQEKIPANYRASGQFSELNNAEIMQHKLYFSGLSELKARLGTANKDWLSFLARF